jgi:hypothetical protein
LPSFGSTAWVSGLPLNWLCTGGQP